MREYCPLCEKNGVKTKIQCYQINWEEAVFMCSSVACPWPLEVEDTLIIQRPVKMYKTKAAMDEIANKYFKKEDDPSSGFLSTYTPPLTPEVITKDASASSQVACPAIIPGNTSTSVNIVDESVLSADNILIDVSKPCDIGTDNPSIKITVSSVKPKLVDSKTVNYKIEKFPDKGYVFKSCGSLQSKTNAQPESKNPIVCTSLADNNVVSKNKPCDKVVKPIGRLKRSKFPPKPFEKFTFEGYLKKSESTKQIKADGDLAVSKKDVIKNENNVNTSIEVSSGTKTIVNTENLVDKVVLNNSPNDKAAMVDSIVLPDVKDCQDDIDLGFEQFFAVNTNEIPVKAAVPDASLQSDIDSLLTSLSKDSGVDQESIDMADCDLDDILGSYSEDLNGALKTSDNQDDYEWSFP